MAFLGIGEDQILADDGSVAAPAITAASDPNTGLAFGVGGVDNFSAVAGGIECLRFSDSGSTPGRMLTSVPLQPLQGTAALPAIAMAINEDYGFYSRTTSAFGTTLGGVQHGWETGRFGAAQFFFAARDEHQTSPVVLCSLGNWNDLDTGISFGTDTSASVGLFTAGVECLRCAPGSELITHPELANSTGIVNDSAAVQTSDATANVTLYSKSIADNTCYVFDVLVTCRDTGGTDRAAYARRVRVHRQGGGVATLGTIEAPYTDETDAAMDCTFTVSSNDLRVSVTGKAATINWAASITYIGAE